MLQLFVCQPRHPARSLNSLCKTCQKKHPTTLHDSPSQPNPHLTATIDALQINRTRSITVLPSKQFDLNGPVHHLRVFVDSCARTNILNLQAMHRLCIKATEAPDRIIRVKQKNAISTHGRMNLTILLMSDNNFKIWLVT